MQDTPNLAALRDEAREALGDRRTVHACQVVAAFDGINRVADVAGIRIDPEMTASGQETIETLDISAMETV